VYNVANLAIWQGVRDTTGPAKGEFVPPPDVSGKDEISEALPEQEEFWRPPVRFGSIPVEKEPMGWDRRRGFRKLYPQVMLLTRCHLCSGVQGLRLTGQKDSPNPKPKR
jgi:hypothetical protein